MLCNSMSSICFHCGMQAISKDANVAVVGAAIGCTAKLAAGMRRDYAGQSRTLAPLLLEKLKDKAAAVSKAALEALDTFHQ